MNFEKQSKSTVESFVLNKDGFIYNLSVTKTGNTIDGVSMNIVKKDGVYVGSGSFKDKYKSVSVLKDENAAAHASVFEEFLKQLGDENNKQ